MSPCHGCKRKPPFVAQLFCKNCDRVLGDEIKIPQQAEHSDLEDYKKVLEAKKNGDEEAVSHI